MFMFEHSSFKHKIFDNSLNYCKEVKLGDIVDITSSHKYLYDTEKRNDKQVNNIFRNLEFKKYD